MGQALLGWLQCGPATHCASLTQQQQAPLLLLLLRWWLLRGCAGHRPS
jgi:hypothetical protein